MQALWDSYADDNHKSRRLKVAKIDCTENTPLCAAENIKAYPTLRLFANQDKYTYRGYRNLPGFTDFVKENVHNVRDGQVPSKIEENIIKKQAAPVEDNTEIKALVLTDGTFAKVIDDEYTFVDFYAPWCPHCIKLEPVWNQLATRYKHDKKVTIAKVDCTAEPEICKVQAIAAYPSLALYKNGIMINQYNGQRTLFDFVNFIESSVDRSPPVKEDVIPQEFNKLVEDLDKPTRIHLTGNEFMTGIQYESYLLYFNHMSSPASEEYLTVFDQVTAELKEWNLDVTCVIMDCKAHKWFCDDMKVNVFPTIIYYKTLHEKYLYNGPMDMLKIVQFTEKAHRNIEPKKDEL